jgi:hypothetical protein
VIGKSINNPAQIAKGSFGPTFAEEPSSPNKDKADSPSDKDEIEAKANNKNKKGSRTKRKRDSLMQTLSWKSQDLGTKQIYKACGSGGHLLSPDGLLLFLAHEGATLIQREHSNEKDGRPHASQRHIPQAGRGGSTPEQGESQRRAGLNRERCWAGAARRSRSS